MKTITLANKNNRGKAASHLALFMFVCMVLSTIGSSLTLQAIFSAILPSSIQDATGLDLSAGFLHWVMVVLCWILGITTATVLDHFLFAIQLRAGLTEAIIFTKRWISPEFRTYLKANTFKSSGITFTRVVMATVYLFFGGTGYYISFYTSYNSQEIVAAMIKPKNLAAVNRGKVDEVQAKMKESRAQALGDIEQRIEQLKNEKKAFIDQYIDKKVNRQIKARNPQALAYADSINRVADKRFDASALMQQQAKSSQEWERTVKPAFDKEMSEVYEGTDTKKKYAGMTGLFVMILGAGSCVGMLCIMFVLCLKEVDDMPFVVKPYKGRRVLELDSEGGRKNKPNAQRKSSPN